MNFDKINMLEKDDIIDNNTYISQDFFSSIQYENKKMWIECQ